MSGLGLWSYFFDATPPHPGSRWVRRSEASHPFDGPAEVAIVTRSNGRWVEYNVRSRSKPAPLIPQPHTTGLVCRTRKFLREWAKEDG